MICDAALDCTKSELSDVCVRLFVELMRSLWYIWYTDEPMFDGMFEERMSQ